MKHIVWNRRPPQGQHVTVHTVDPDNPQYTYCGSKFVSDKTFDGHPVYMASETSKHLDCSRCAGVMRTRMFHKLRKYTPAQVESIMQAVLDLS